MEKHILTIGYTIPTFEKNEVDFYGGHSLMDADILLISPEALEPRGHWVSFTVRDGGCYDVEASRTYKQKMSSLRKEIKDHLNAGKNIFVFLTKEEAHSLSSGTSSEKKGVTTYHADSCSNYSFLPVDLGTLTSATGTHIEFTGNSLLTDFYETFKENLKYQLYVENPSAAQVLFTGKDKTKILGAIYKVGNGNIVTLPFVNYNEKDFTEHRGKDKKEYWTKEATQFGKSLVKIFVNIDKALRKGGDRTPPPEWAQDKKYRTNKEEELIKEISIEQKNIETAEKKIKEAEVKIQDEKVLSDLLFEQGKPLEQAVIKALRILGYSAEGYDDGTLELDQVIISPEGDRYIGECEGKDNKDIDITKFRQLSESLSADFAREEVSEKAFGILFGNPQRLLVPDERTLDFTQKCKIGADREKIALVKTIDLYNVTKYLSENTDKAFQKKCRAAIHAGLGAVVSFPEPKPTKKSE